MEAEQRDKNQLTRKGSIQRPFLDSKVNSAKDQNKISKNKHIEFNKRFWLLRIAFVSSTKKKTERILAQLGHLQGSTEPVSKSPLSMMLSFMLTTLTFLVILTACKLRYRKSWKIN